VIFYACCVYPVCIIRCILSESAIISRDRGHLSELPHLWLTNSSDLKQIDYKIRGIIQESTRLQDVNDLIRRIDVWAKAEYSADVSVPASSHRIF